MRKFLLLLGLAGALTGGTCIPLVDNTTRKVEPPQELAIAISTPLDELTVAQGEDAEIVWTGSNLSGQSATVALIAESRRTLDLTTLVAGVPFEGTGDSGRYTWNTAGFAGAYSIIVRLETATETAEATSQSLIRVDTPPTFEFLEPDTDTQLASGDTVTIRWRAGDDSQPTAEIGIDVDTDHDSGNESIIAEPNLPAEVAVDSLAWDGALANGGQATAGTYNLYARVIDGINESITVDGLAKITIPEPNVPEGFVVPEPSEDAEYIFGDAEGVTIEFRPNRTLQDVLADVKVDPDDTRSNGNDITVISRLLVEADTDPNVVEWKGRDDDGNQVETGIYNVYVTITGETGTPQTKVADGRVMVRDTDTQPLIELLEPASDQTVNDGEDLVIRWRDDDPEEDSKVRIILSDNEDPTAPGANKITLLDDEEASQDGVKDLLRWSVSGLTAGTTYYVIAYVERAGEEDMSVAAGTVELSDG